MANTNKKILIVEDELSMKKVLVEKFEKEGFEILEAKNGEEGLEVAEKEMPDLILLDIIMPHMDGMSMLNRLRKNEKIKDIPVIVLTNLSEPEDVADSLEKGVKDYLVKTDWSLDEVVDKVKKRLK